MENISEQVVVKTEMQSNGEILLFYVDENGDNEEGVLTTVQNIENDSIELQDVDSLEHNLKQNEIAGQDLWTDDEIHRLLVFYIDNKGPFLSGTTKRNHLWIVACKTMLVGKNPASCETKLKSLRDNYVETCWYKNNGINAATAFFDLCHQAFYDDANVKSQIENFTPIINDINTVNVIVPDDADNVVVLKKISNDKVEKSKNVDDKVKLLLSLYLWHKKSFQTEYPRKDLWDAIAKEIGDDDGTYWQKRFLNYKQHYIRMVEKRKSGGEVNWPYMDLFDKIFEDDEEFKRKYSFLSVTPIITPTETAKPTKSITWNVTEMTVLAKYCYDCFDEFIDETIPNNFLWTEIGRLLDKTPELCKLKYNQLKNEHYVKYIEGDYDIRTRKPLQIIFDNLLSKEVEFQLQSNKPNESHNAWKTSQTDEVVQLMYDNVEMFKDPICHFVCWGAIAKKLRKDVRSCRKQWEELVTLYKSLLNDDHDMQNHWKYLDLFDRIFDYGMDKNLLAGYEKINQQKTSDTIGVKQVKINLRDEEAEKGTDNDEELFDEDNKKKSKHGGDSKAFKILEYYQKNKDRFTTTNRNKHSLWDVLAKQIGISATQCAHRFRNLKQVYTAYVQREIHKPEMPIMWPYYILCKKVFGYRAIKAKLRHGKMDSDDSEEWSAKEIKMLINYFGKNFDDINSNIDDASKWVGITTQIARSDKACKDKFLELRRSYRKLKTQISRNPNVKISWKYFSMFENIYKGTGNPNQGKGISQEPLKVEHVKEEWVEDDKSQLGEDDYQCIIVLPDGQDISDMDTSEIIIQNVTEQQSEETKPVPKWTKRLKKRLLISYVKYIRAHKGKEMDKKEIWKDISSQLEKTPLACRKMFLRLKANHKKTKEDNDVKRTPYYTLLERVTKLKPKFAKLDKSMVEENRTYKDVEMSKENVIKSLQYYLQHIEEFVSPKFDKKYMWTELANFVSEAISKVYNKVNYLKQVYDKDNTSGIADFDEILKEIIAKEIAIKLVRENELNNIEEFSDDNVWSDEEVKQLLEWYLSNLDKFKNPKFTRKYLWIEVSNLLKKSPLGCSKKMTAIRTQYRTMVKENSEELNMWNFYELCQKIYGTGKKVVADN